MSKIVAMKKCKCGTNHIVGLDDLVAFAKDAGFSLVPRQSKEFGPATLCRLMDDCLPDGINDENDMGRMISKLWPALVCEHEQN